MFLNFKLLSHPINWITVVLMIVIGGFLFHLLEQNFNQPPSVAK
jgi:hypothetical protein